MTELYKHLQIKYTIV